MSSICPWLGTDTDRRLRYADPSVRHACYAQQRAAKIAPEHQAEFCLGPQHPECRFYLEPPPPPAPAPLAAAEDLVGPAPRRGAAVQVALWALVVLAAAAAIYVYGRQLLKAPPQPTPIAAPLASALALASASPSPTATAPAGSLATAPAAGLPTATPTPFPGGAIYGLSPPAGAAGWAASDEARGNHLGDSYLYAGVFDGVTYHGAFQLDLSSLPRGAEIHAGALELTGLSETRLGSSGTWEVRILDRAADEGWARSTFQDLHNAAVQWSLPPALAVQDLAAEQVNAFALSPEQLGDLEQRLIDQHYTLSFRIDGPLAGENSVFAWDAGSGPATRGGAPRLWLSVGAPPRTPVAYGSPAPTQTATPTPVPDWVVVTSTPTPGNFSTAVAVALQQTAWATTTGTPTATPWFVATATPRYVVVTNTPTPENYATAAYWRALATADAILTGTPTPTPHNLATATVTPLPTRTPEFTWLDQMTGTPVPSVTPTPLPVPASLRGKILYLSDRRGQVEAYMLDPASGRVAVLSARWPYDQALKGENVAPDGQAFAHVQNDVADVPQVYIHSPALGASRQVTFNKGMSYDPVWSPTGDRLAFVSTLSGSDELYTIGVDGRDQKRLTFNLWEWDKHPSWSPDGTRIVFWSNQDTGRAQLWIVNADGTGRRLLLDSPSNDWDPVWVK